MNLNGAIDQDFVSIASIPFASADSPHQGFPNTFGDDSSVSGDSLKSLSSDESSNIPVNEPTNPKTNRFLCLRSKEKPYSKRQNPFEWHEEHTVKVPKLVDPPQRDESDMKLLFQPQTGKKDMELDVKCKHPLSLWLMSNPKHQRNLIDFNGVIQSESRRKSLEKRWREEAIQRRKAEMRQMGRRRPRGWYDPRSKSGPRRKSHIIEQRMKEKEQVKAGMKKELGRGRIFAHVKVSCLDSSKHQQLQKYMNSMQNDSDDILEIDMYEKANVEKEKWKVIGLINPDVHLSTLDHSVNLHWIPEMGSEHFDVVNYHHWIPTVFKVNRKGMDSPHVFCFDPLSLIYLFRSINI